MINQHYNVFLSCRRDTGLAFAKTLQEAFLNRGLTVICDFDVSQNASFEEVVKSCDVFVAALSEGYFQPETGDSRPLMEYKYALKQRKLLVPVMRMDTDINMPIRENHYVLMDGKELGGIPVSDIHLGANFDESVDWCMEKRFPDELKLRNRMTEPFPSALNGADGVSKMLEEMAQHPMGAALTKLVHLASFFTSEGFRKHVLRRLWDKLVVHGTDTNETFETAFDFLLAHGWLMASSKEFCMPRRISIPLRRAALKTCPKIEEDIGKALKDYLGMFPRDWLPLADSTLILSFIPEFVLFWRQNENRFMSSSFSLQARLLFRNPEFLPFCRLDLLNGWDWAGLLVYHPQLAGHCQWEKLESKDWTYLLEFQPQFANHCDWEILDGRDWAKLLRVWPTFADHCRWEKLEGQHWSSLLGDQPQFADRCSWDKLDGQDWSCLLQRKPQFSNHCPWGELDGEDWKKLLTAHPTFMGHCALEKLSPNNWTELLIAHPQLADRCPWEKLNGFTWGWLLGGQPQFADRCPWEQLKGADWSRLLCRQPQFADRCPWGELDGEDWKKLLLVRPQFSSRCSWETLDGTTWALLLSGQPQFADYCPWGKLDGQNWGYLLGGQPQFADHCDWSLLCAKDWRNLLECQPQFITCWKENEEKLDWPMNWAKLLRYQPCLTDYCPWKRLDGRDWAFLLEEQPQFVDRCPYKTFKDWDRNEFIKNVPQATVILQDNNQQQNEEFCKSDRDIDCVLVREDEKWRKCVEKVVEEIKSEDETLQLSFFQRIKFEDDLVDVAISTDSIALLLNLLPGGVDYKVEQKSNIPCNCGVPEVEQRTITLDFITMLERIGNTLRRLSPDSTVEIGIVASDETCRRIREAIDESCEDVKLNLLTFGNLKEQVVEIFKRHEDQDK